MCQNPRVLRKVDALVRPRFAHGHRIYVGTDIHASKTIMLRSFSVLLHLLGRFDRAPLVFLAVLQLFEVARHSLLSASLVLLRERGRPTKRKTYVHGGTRVESRRRARKAAEAVVEAVWG